MKPCSAVETRLPSKQKIVGSIPTRVMVLWFYGFMVLWFYGLCTSFLVYQRYTKKEGSLN